MTTAILTEGNDVFVSNLVPGPGETGNRIDALGGEDSVAGNQFNDFIFGENGDDSLLGEGGDDALVGGNGSNSLFGGTGDDVLIGGNEAV